MIQSFVPVDTVPVRRRRAERVVSLASRCSQEDNFDA
jgi:hypothetical protein